MLCKRLVIVLTFNDGVLTRTKKFSPDYIYTKNFVDVLDVDEMVFLDVTRGGNREAFFRGIGAIMDNCFAPTTLGGGIRTLDDVKEFFDNGADKVTVNTGALLRPDLIGDIAVKYGSQAVVLSIDARGDRVYSHCGQERTDWSPVEWANRGVSLGAGEILINSLDRDGSLQGYDLEMNQAVAEAVSVPVMFLGGAGNWQHLVDGVNAGADAVCTQVIHHFTGNSITAAKRYMADKGIHVRS